MTISVLNCFLLMTVLCGYDRMVALAANEECLIPDLGTQHPPAGTKDQDKQSATKHSNLIHIKTIHPFICKPELELF